MELGRAHVAEGDHFRELCPVSICISGNGISPAGRLSRPGAAATMESLAAGEEQHRVRALAGDLAQDEDRLRFEPVEMAADRQGGALGARLSPGPRSCFVRGGGTHETAVRSNVQPAFARFPDLPPPAAGANVFARDGGDGCRARSRWNGSPGRGARCRAPRRRGCIPIPRPRSSRQVD